MDDKHPTADGTEQAFSEYYSFNERVKKTISSPPADARSMLIAYMQLAESYEKLLKTAVRIAKMGDRAQKKLLRYKELMDTLRNID